jgi:glyoxylase-like metal-dependent hydrolase (beta-lactamase superfamily II)
MTTHARLTIDCEDSPPRFTAAYLRVAGDECAFVETYTSRALPKMLAALAAQNRAPEDVRWIVVTHAHLDHAAGASALVAACPNATLVAHPRAARALVDPEKLVAGAKAVYGAERFAELYGEVHAIPKERVRTLDDGEAFELGGATLRAWHTYGHAFHHMIVDDPAIGTVFTGDTFGLVYPALQARGRFAIPSTSPTGFDAAEARKSIDRVLGLNEGAACLTHFDEVRDLDEVARQLRAWIDRAEAWLSEAIASGASVEIMTARLARAWRGALKQEAESRGLDFGEDEWKLLAMDIALNAQGIAAVAEAKRK